MTDAELQGLALQALNMAKRDYEAKSLKCLLASYHSGEGIHRMRSIETAIVERLGEGWLNDPGKKVAAFSMLKWTIRLQPPDAFVIVTAGNAFRTTEAFAKLSPEEGMAIWNAGHTRHHRAVEEGLLKMDDVLIASAQNPQRVCIYTQTVDGYKGFQGPPHVEFYDQRTFAGNLKMF